MKKSFKLLVMVMLTTPYTMMYTSTSEKQPRIFKAGARSIYDKLEERKQRFIDGRSQSNDSNSSGSLYSKCSKK